MPYGLFQPWIHHIPVQELDWSPFYGFQGANRPRPTARRNTVVLFDASIAPCYSRWPVARTRSSVIRPPVDIEESTKRTVDLFRRNGDLHVPRRQRASPWYLFSTSIDEECVAEKPQNNLRLKARLDQSRYIRRPAVDSKITSKIGLNNTSSKDGYAVADSENCPANNDVMNCSSVNEDLPESVAKESKELHEICEDLRQVDEKSPEEMGINTSTVKQSKIDSIEKISSDVTMLSQKVDDLKCGEKNKDFLYLEEMLTKCLLGLDDIQTAGIEDVRKSRKSVVDRINSQLRKLEDKIVCGVKGDGNVLKGNSENNNIESTRDTLV